MHYTRWYNVGGGALVRDEWPKIYDNGGCIAYYTK